MVAGRFAALLALRSTARTALGTTAMADFLLYTDKDTHTHTHNDNT